MDYYLEDRARLQGKPKATIADYVEQSGFLVPGRFGSFAEAKASGLPIIARKEHEQDYDGVSGFLTSIKPKAFTEAADEADLRKSVLKDSNTESYCQVLGLDRQRFEQQISFSYWHYIKGFNRVVAADSAIIGRFHVMTDRYPEGDENDFINYSIVEDGKVIRSFGRQLSPYLKNGLAGLIQMYEKIRNLERFSRIQRPLMEMETVDSKDFFLQYLRTADFKESSFTLSRGPERGEVESLMVRGATPPQGIDCAFTLSRGPDPKLETEEGGFSLENIGWVFTELMLPRRKVHIINDYPGVMEEIAVNHNHRSQMFKPEISIRLDCQKILTDEEQSLLFQSAYCKRAYLRLHVVSDGRRAFVSRI